MYQLIDDLQTVLLKNRKSPQDLAFIRPMIYARSVGELSWLNNRMTNFILKLSDLIINKLEMEITIPTEKLILGPVELSDLQNMYEIRTNSQVAKYINRDINKSLEDIRQFIETVRKNDFYFTIKTKECNKFIGTITLWNIDWSKKYAEIGYELLPRFQGKGLMSEAVKGILDYAFNEAGFQHIEAYTHHENIASRKLLEGIGFKLITDKVDSDNLDNLIYGINNTAHKTTSDHF